MADTSVSNTSLSATPAPSTGTMSLFTSRSNRIKEKEIEGKADAASENNDDSSSNEEGENNSPQTPVGSRDKQSKNKDKILTVEESDTVLDILKAVENDDVADDFTDLEEKEEVGKADDSTDKEKAAGTSTSTETTASPLKMNKKKKKKKRTNRFDNENPSNMYDDDSTTVEKGDGPHSPVVVVDNPDKSPPPSPVVASGKSTIGAADDPFVELAWAYMSLNAMVGTSADHRACPMQNCS